MDNTPEQYSTTDTTEQRIFDAAREVFVQKGLEGARMQEIADKAGINKALLHYYYRTKEKLFEMVVKAVLSRAVPVVRQLIEVDMPLEEKLARLISFYLEVLSRNPFIPYFLITEMNKHPEDFLDRVMPKELPRPEVFFKQVDAEIAAGRIRPIKPQHLLVHVVSMCVFPFLARPMIRIIMGMNAAEHQQFLAERKEEVLPFVLAALRPDPISNPV